MAMSQYPQLHYVELGAESSETGTQEITNTVGLRSNGCETVTIERRITQSSSCKMEISLHKQQNTVLHSGIKCYSLTWSGMTSSLWWLTFGTVSTPSLTF